MTIPNQPKGWEEGFDVYLGRFLKALGKQQYKDAKDYFRSELSTLLERVGNLEELEIIENNALEGTDTAKAIYYQNNLRANIAKAISKLRKEYGL